ncbi:MAG: hypothetical protein CBC89_01885 [Euryarchaeota archaeon TMED129]|nr:MAG: hypothetical protein CBC89_01885 [Euryarchaeota archaeon TMED129]
MSLLALEEVVGAESRAVILVEHKVLKEHEEIIENNLNIRIKKIKKRGFYKPIIADNQTNVILDGHHKWNAAKQFGLSKVPTIFVDYFNDSGVQVDVWPECGKDSITKEEVIEMGLSKNVFPPKTSKHSFDFEIPSLSIPLEKLRDG